MAVGGVRPADDLVAVRVLKGGVRQGEAQLAEEAVAEISGGDGGGGGARGVAPRELAYIPPPALGWV